MISDALVPIHMDSPFKRKAELTQSALYISYYSEYRLNKGVGYSTFLFFSLDDKNSWRPLFLYHIQVLYLFYDSTLFLWLLP